MVHHYLEDHPDYAREMSDSVGHYLSGYDQMMGIKYPSEREVIKAQMEAQFEEEQERQRQRRAFNKAVLDADALVPEYVTKRRGVTSAHAERMSHFRLTANLNPPGTLPESRAAAALPQRRTDHQTARPPASASASLPSSSSGPRASRQLS